MRLERMKRRHRPVLEAKIGGHPVTIVDNGERGPYARLTFDKRSQFAVIAHESYDLFQLNSLILVDGCYIEFSEQQKGNFTEQAIGLLGMVAEILRLFPIELEDLYGRVEVNAHSHWVPAINFLRYEFKEKEIAFIRIPIQFTCSAEPLCGHDNPIILRVTGQMRITNLGITILDENIREQTTGMVPSGDVLVANAVWNKLDEIRLRIKQTSDDIPIIIPNKTSLANLEWTVTSPVEPKRMIQWLIEACLDCGVEMPETDLSRFGIKPRRLTAS